MSLQSRYLFSAAMDVEASREALFNEVRKHPVCPYREVRWFPAHLGFDIDPGEVQVHFITRGTSLVTAHGGRLSAARNVDFGTTFTVALPIHPD